MNLRAAKSSRGEIGRKQARKGKRHRRDIMSKNKLEFISFN
jgi:hypothetical protein